MRKDLGALGGNAVSKIDRVEDLPQWFDLEHYQGAESFGAVEWYKQLSQRRALLTLLDYMPDEAAFYDQAVKAFSRCIGHVRGVSVEDAHIPNFFGAGGIDQALLDFSRSVHPLTLNQLHQHARVYEGGSLQGSANWFLGVDQPDRDEKIEAPLFLTDLLSYPRERFAALRVDLDAPDSVILESFAAWLSETRSLKGQPREKEFYRPRYQQWARYGLLPYLDLAIWKKETGVRIPDRVMAAAISRYDAGESNVRKTVKPLAQALMGGTQEFEALAALAALEAATQTEK